LKSSIETNDIVLWRQAKRKVAFKRMFILYIIICVASWLYWYKIEGIADGGIPWPLFPTILGIPILLVLKARVKGKGKSAIEKEYEKLKAKQG
jgi:hypothetical protein